MFQIAPTLEADTGLPPPSKGQELTLILVCNLGTMRSFAGWISVRKIQLVMIHITTFRSAVSQFNPPAVYGIQIMRTITDDTPTFSPIPPFSSGLQGGLHAFASGSRPSYSAHRHLREADHSHHRQSRPSYRQQRRSCAFSFVHPNRS
jgi:hypothetical protein